MSIFKNLSNALEEVIEHLEGCPEISAFVVKTKQENENPYCPVYILDVHNGNFGKSFNQMIKDGHGEVITVFALVR